MKFVLSEHKRQYGLSLTCQNKFQSYAIRICYEIIYAFFLDSELQARSTCRNNLYTNLLWGLRGITRIAKNTSKEDQAESGAAQYLSIISILFFRTKSHLGIKKINSNYPSTNLHLLVLNHIMEYFDSQSSSTNESLH